MSSTETTWTQDAKTKATNSVTATSSETVTGTFTADKIKLSGNIIQASNGGNTITLDTSDNVSTGGNHTHRVFSRRCYK